jgi:hypothetical protein
MKREQLLIGKTYPHEYDTLGNRQSGTLVVGAATWE